MSKVPFKKQITLYLSGACPQPSLESLGLPSRVRVIAVGRGERLDALLGRKFTTITIHKGTAQGGYSFVVPYESRLKLDQVITELPGCAIPTKLFYSELGRS